MLKIEDEFKFAPESVREFAPGDVIFREGEDSREMYIVVSGEVAVSKHFTGGDVVLARMKKGEFVGEMSLLESLPRSATARAEGPTRLLAIHPGGFLLKIRRDPTFAFEMLQTLSRRIRITNENLMRELNHQTSTPDSIRKVLHLAEYNKEDKSA